MKKVFLLLGIVSLTAFSAIGQSFQQFCSQAEHDQEELQKDPTLKLKWAITHKLYEDKIAELKKHPNQKTTEQVYVIPVVFHIMHNYGQVYTDFMNNRQIYYDAVDEINYQFRNSDSLDIDPPFDKISHNTNIVFKLAQKDPNGNLTEGFTLNQTTLTIDADNSVKGVIQWDNKKYLNIWIVRSIGSGAGGWSHLPGIADNLDGIVMLNGQLGDLAHECGHWLGLEHPWGGSNDADLATNCGIDDGIADTPNTRGNLNNCTTALQTRRNSCSDSPVPFRDYLDTYDLWPVDSGEIHDNVNNIMDYAFCSKENFTEGQKAYIRNTLATSPHNGRTYIWTEQNLRDAGICDTCGPYNIPPIAEFDYSDELICANSSIDFTDLSYNGDATSWSWDFGDGTTDTTQNPSHTYTAPGVYDVTLTASNAGGSDAVTKSTIITVGAVTGGEVAPFYENFENGDFPTVGDPIKEWTVQNGYPTEKWKLNSNASATGLYSYSLKLSSLPDDKIYTLRSPTIDWSSPDKALEVTYKYAYAPRVSSSSDKIQVHMSADCGENWQLVYAASASTMNTSGNTSNSATFTPTADQWKEQSISITQSTLIGADHLLLRFELTTGGGNYFYIDDINVGGSESVGIAEDQDVYLDVYPNPFSNDASIKLSVENGGDMEMSIFNVIGERLYSNTRFYGRGKHNVNLSDLIDVNNSGIYFVKIKSASGTITKKVVRY